MRENIEVSLNLEQQMCNNCKKISTEYFELKLQVRFIFSNKKNIKYRDQIFEDYNDYYNYIKNELTEYLKKYFNRIIVNKSQILKNGFDLFLNDFSSKKLIIDYFKKSFFIDFTLSKKIVGRNFLRSRDIFKYTLLIDIINISKNDYLYFKGKKYQVFSVFKNKLSLIDSFGKKKVITYSLNKDYISLFD